MLPSFASTPTVVEALVIVLDTEWAGTDWLYM